MQGERIDVETVKKHGWRDQHILVVSEGDERLNVIERELIRKLGDRLYGTPAREASHG